MYVSGVEPIPPQRKPRDHRSKPRHHLCFGSFSFCAAIILGEQTATLYQPLVNIDIVAEKWASNSKEILSF